MKTKLSILSAMIITWSVIPSIAQVKVKSLSLSAGGISRSFNPVGINLANLVPNSQYGQAMRTDTSFANLNQNFGSNFYTNGAPLKLEIGLQIGGENKANQELRFGVMTSNGILGEAKGVNYIYRIDTMTSSTTGRISYMDSIYSKNIFGNAIIKSLIFDVSYVFHTDRSRRFNLYGGLGLRQSINLNKSFYSIQSNSSFSYINDAANVPNTNFIGNYYSYYPYYANSRYNGNSGVSEQINNPSGLKYSMTQIYVPLGVEFLLSKKENFLHHLRLYGEATPTLTFQKISGQSYNFGGVGGFFGIKYSF